jgi:hypothetical protein
MHGVFRGLALALLAATLAPATPLIAQQSPDNFRWIDFHSKQDQDTVVWVMRSLDPEKWSAIREIGVEYDAALVVTTLRKTPQTPPALDSFSIWSASLTNHSITLLLTGTNLRLLDWMLFAVGRPRDLGALYDDCNECDASTFLTAFYYDVRSHNWAARWMRGNQAIPLSSANAPQGVTSAQAYAVLADPNGHEVVGTWNHLDYGKAKAPEDYVYQYDVDASNDLERTQVLSGKSAEAMKRRICVGSDAVTGLARGQDSSLCQAKIQSPHGTARKPAN